MTDEFLDGDRSDRDYWNRRVVAYKDNEEDMIWAVGHDFKQRYDRLATSILELYKNDSVVDVACGFGRFCEIFKPENYFGFDFSDEMIKLAREKHPGYKFKVQDYFEFEIQKVDVVFNVISVGNIGVSPEEFISKYKHFARKAVITMDAKNIIIYPI